MPLFLKGKHNPINDLGCFFCCVRVYFKKIYVQLTHIFMKLEKTIHQVAKLKGEPIRVAEPTDASNEQKLAPVMRDRRCATSGCRAEALTAQICLSGKEH